MYSAQVIFEHHFPCKKVCTILDKIQQAAQHVTKIIFVTIMNLVTPKAGAKHELLLNKPASSVTAKGIERI